MVRAPLVPESSIKAKGASCPGVVLKLVKGGLRRALSVGVEFEAKGCGGRGRLAAKQHRKGARDVSAVHVDRKQASLHLSFSDRHFSKPRGTSPVQREAEAKVGTVFDSFRKR